MGDLVSGLSGLAGMATGGGMPGLSSSNSSEASQDFGSNHIVNNASSKNETYLIIGCFVLAIALMIKNK